MLKSMDSLFHFTKDLDVLFSILTTGFTGSFCKEVFKYGDSELEQYVPKISFCDLTENTLSEYKNYGNYGIGISKDWGKENKLNPVLYLENNSLISKSFIDGINSSRGAYGFVNSTCLALGETWRAHQNNDQHLLSSLNINTDVAWEYLNVLQATKNVLDYNNYSMLFIKPYDGYLLRQGVEQHYCFYDEREWCYVPEMNEFLTKYNKNQEQFLEWRGNGAKPLLDDLKLNFKFIDVTHLLVKDESDVTELANKINQLDNSIISIEDKERLKSLIKIF
ncbi:abortive infection system antitoxin AbiGi family protein [Myroides sp.]|uniref:abortive infection system antitoxin AbiGi family protein n=1 Tax=Myroides sp. TaxID=1874736 RepID=UPI0028A5F619|nr:abortive infection system antitoxin AbiGi family protein [Myroides sp.]